MSDRANTHTLHKCTTVGWQGALNDGDSIATASSLLDMNTTHTHSQIV